MDEDDEFSSSSNSYSSKQRSGSRRKSDRDFNESERIYFEAEREAFEKIKQDFFSNRFTLEHLSLKPGESINKELILENKTLRILKEQLTKQRDEVIFLFSKSFGLRHTPNPPSLRACLGQCSFQKSCVSFPIFIGKISY